MIAAILDFLTGSFARRITEALRARSDAQTERERIAADVRVEELKTRQANRALGGLITAWVQAAWAAPFIIYNWKLLVWDKVLGKGATDVLSEDLMTMQLRIATFYFGGAAVIGVVGAIRRRGRA